MSLTPPLAVLQGQGLRLHQALAVDGLRHVVDLHQHIALAGLEVTVNLEKKFQIKIPPARYEELVSIAAIGAIVQELLDAKAQLQQAA